MGSSLTFAYDFSGDPDDDFGWLGVAVSTANFTGRCGFWVQWQDVREFGDKLATYPISPDAPLKAAWGYEPWEGDALVVSVEIAPATSRGDLAVKVELRDHTEPSECLRTSFITNYPDLEAFKLAITNLMDGKADEAELIGR